MIPARYRKDYDGEFVVTSTNWRRGSKDQEREWIPNPIENQHISGVAAAIGSSADRELFDYTILERHRGGLQGRRRLQTYGTGNVWNDMRLDFYATTDQIELNQLHRDQYGQDSIVYTTSRFCLKFPGEFFLIPHLPNIHDMALPLYITAFDGHQEIFLIGYNKDTCPEGSRQETDVNAVIASYPTHQYVLVGVESNMPGLWQYNNNVRCMDYRKFISYCDV